MFGEILAESDSFWKALFSHHDTAVLFFLFGLFALCVAIPVITGAWVTVSRNREDAALKRTMIERGMSVDEIERVLKAKSSEK